MSTSSGDPVLVADQDELDRAVAAARLGGAMGLDTEFVRERTYRARLCVVQISTAERTFVIDALSSVDLDGVAGLISDPEVETVVHAGRQDLEIFHERYGSLPSRVFDVQLAAGFVGHGASLPYEGLVRSVLGFRVAKGESYTDWSRRPLTGAQLRYAADDVRHLLPAAARLRAEAEKLGRDEWVREEMALLSEPGSFEVNVGDAWRKVGGRRSLNERQLAVLKRLAAWREETAMRRDLPRGWVLKDPTLLEIARRSPSSMGALKEIRGMPVKEAERSGRALLAAVQQAKSDPPGEPATGPPRELQMRARLLAGMADAVVRARCEQARVAYELVTTRADLEAALIDAISPAPRGRARLLTGWRRAVAGDALLALAAGKVAVKAIEEPPYVSEVAV
ncbi:ribonuclease D [soil metagenome]